MTPVTRIGMLLLPAFNSMAAQAFIDPFRAANYLRGDNLYEWTFLSPKGDHVRASNGLLIAETQAYTDYAEVPDFLVVNASWTPERFKQRKLQHWLCHDRREQRHPCSLQQRLICRGFYRLALLHKGHIIPALYGKCEFLVSLNILVCRR